MRRRPPRLRLVLVSVLAILPVSGFAGTAPGPATPHRNSGVEPPAAKDRPPAVDFSVDLQRTFDDNILELTRRDLGRLMRKPGSSSFRIETPEDQINTLQGAFRWRARPFRRRETRFAAGADLYFHERNAISDWQEYALSARQELTASQRHRTTLDLRFHYRPGFYLGEVTDADDSFEEGRRIRRSLNYEQTLLGIDLTRVPRRDRASATFGFERRHRNYGPEFRERDGDDNSWHVELEGRPLRRVGLSAGFLYRSGRFAARGDLITSEIRDIDTSYRHRGLGLWIDVPWGRRSSRGHVEFRFEPETRRYTTADKFDVSRFGRTNRYLEYSVEATQRTGPLEWQASLNRRTREALFPDDVDVDAGDYGFERTRYGLLVRFRSG